eukprot:scaffold39525_cov55-Phaeocystis_antarctica.AAC.6
MGCCGSKKQSDSRSFEGGRAVSGAVVPAAAKQADPVMLLVKRVMQSAMQAAKRAAQLETLAALPEHLRLGVTLAGMRELLEQLPSDAVEQVNANIPLDKVTGKPKFPENDVENGYVNQFHITRSEKEDKLTVCERLKARGSPHVGEATVFVSWFLDTPIATLLDALANFLKEKGLRDEDTFFWVCDYVIRQTKVGPDLELLGDCVSAIGHTVLLLEPWNDPQPLKRAYCIKEVYYTQVSGATFDMVMTEQQQSFERELVSTSGFLSIEEGLSRVDVRQVRTAPWLRSATSWGPEPFLSDSQADCRNAKDKADILDELQKGVGFDKCNTLVVGLLREALVAQGRAALGRLSAAERRGSVLLMNLGMLLEDMGQLEEARPLYEERLQGYRETLGDRHPRTLGAICFLAFLLEEQGKLVEAIPLYTEVLEGYVLLDGMEHEDTRDMAKRLVFKLREAGQRKEAMALAFKHGWLPRKLGGCNIC